MINRLDAEGFQRTETFFRGQKREPTGRKKDEKPQKSHSLGETQKRLLQQENILA